MSEIVDLLRMSLASNPGDWNVRRAVVEQMVKEGDLAGCAEVIRSSPASLPDTKTALRFSQLVRAWDLGCALRLVEGGLSLNASDGELHFAKAEILLDAGRIAEAGTHYSVAKTFSIHLASADFERRLGEAAIAATGGGSGVGAEERAVERFAPPPAAEVSRAVEEEPREEWGMASAESENPVEEVEVAEGYFPSPVVQPAAEGRWEPEVEVAEIEEAEFEEAEYPGGAAGGQEVEGGEEEVIPVTALRPVPVSELPKLRPLIDPSLVPEAHRLHTAPVQIPAPAIHYTHREELMETRAHLAVFNRDGMAIDADLLTAEEWVEADGEPGLLVAEGGYRPAPRKVDRTQEKVGAILTTLLVHVGIALLLWVLVISIPMPKPPEIVATTMAPNTETKVSKKVMARQVQQKPSAPSQNVAQIITAATTAQVSAPTVDFETETDTVELGTSFGIGMGFGSGGTGTGGKFSFMGNSGSGNRVVFAVDYSASMNSGGREALMKEELAKSIARLPRGSQYQVVIFSGFAFPHDAVKDAWLKDKNSWGPRNGDLLRKMVPSGSSGRLKDSAADITIPSYSYLEAIPANTQKSRAIIEEMPLTYGTNWEHPVIMALSIKPKPDIIFFMTDGAVGDPTKAIEAITELNKKGKPAQINTTAMMEPRAATELALLAEKNGGKFTIVMKDGKVVKGEDYFKNKK